MRRRTPFVALIGSYVISVAGTSMSAVAIPWMVLTTTGSAAKTGLVAFAEMAPYVAAQALAGPLVDRAGLRRSFVVGNAVAAVAVGAIPLMSAAHALTLPVLLGLVALAGGVRGAADTANSALVPTTATAAGMALERAAGLNSGANRTALLLGAPLAGALVTLAGSPVVVAIDAATFAVAAAIGAIWVRVPRTAPATNEADGSGLRRYGRDLAAGLRFIRTDRLLLGIITMVAVTNLLDQGLSEVMLPVWVRDTVGSAGALGLLAGIGGLGSVLGNLFGAWLGPRLSRRALYSVGYLVGGAPRFLVLVVAGTLAPVIGVTLVAEVFAGSLNPVIGATSYERIPEELRARVLGVVRASAWVGIPFGALVGGYVIEAVGTRMALLAFGVAYLLTTLAPFVFPSWRQLRRPDPVVATDPEMVTA
ncbi:MFS transporter [Rugosimonospora africana]|uniref:MFS transporter n=1 Tax=Rugosimonospora africana TaxID=556532 RepID=A0A8J3QTV9_9ACTN|nr:MFS transporter [Rugosimonospora africana]GIH14766.1 MFS transporter [Rugosimonospora africana]